MKSKLKIHKVNFSVKYLNLKMKYNSFLKVFMGIVEDICNAYSTFYLMLLNFPKFKIQLRFD